MAPTRVGDIPAGLLPPTVAAPIFAKANEISAVQQLARKVPLALTASTSIPVPMDVPTADWVEQGGRKPVSAGGVGIRTMTGKKVACLVPVAEEVARTNAAGLYDQLQQDLPTALARAFDRAAIHGQTMSGATGPFPDFIANTSKRVALGTATKGNGGIWADLVGAMKLVVDDNWDFDGWVADQRLRPTLLLAVDNNGRPILVDSAATGVAKDPTRGGILIDSPVMYSRGVSGKVNRQSGALDTGLRAVGGDWTQTAYGVGMDISIRVSTQASYIDADEVWHSAFQENLVLLLCEAVYGFVLGDAEAFGLVTDPSVSSAS